MTEQIQFTGRNLTEMFRLPCVQAIIKGTDGRPILELNRAMMSDGGRPVSRSVARGAAGGKMESY